MASSLETRNDLARILHLDLIGPQPRGTYEKEALEIPPSRFYLSGFIVPHEADQAWKSAEDGQEEVDSVEGDGTGDDEAVKDRASARKVFFPSSIGVSVCVPVGTKTLELTASWGDYTHDSAKDEEKNEEKGTWQRHPRLVTWTVPVTTKRHLVPGHDDVALSVLARPLKLDPKMARDAGLDGAIAVSLFLLNDRKQVARKKNETFMFQVELRAKCEAGFVARPNLRGLHSEDFDERIADLQYRDAPEYAVGHGVGTQTVPSAKGCHEVVTTWLPMAEVEKVIAAPVAGEFDMGRLAKAASGEALVKNLTPLATAYAQWLEKQHVKGLSARREVIASELLTQAKAVCRRIEDGISLLREPKIFRAFTLANAAMEAQARQRNKLKNDLTPPSWRPFQLAFVLMNLRGVVDPSHADRERVDLLFFPTGGGKTEAYLGLAAFTLLYRRLTNPGLSSIGVSVLMRYTLRLLTLDQLQRAATLICGLELLRQDKSNQDLGPWPFEIGLWVGRAATPNKLGQPGDGDENSARKRVLDYQGDTKKPLPIPLETCPWCGAGFTPNSFQLVPSPDAPLDLRVMCTNRSADGEGKLCDFSGKGLPMLTVDESIYRRLPCFLIATMDKFAALPWEARAGALFGKVDRFDEQGFYGAADEGHGKRLKEPVLPPDLIIQDELHLISGPLGTVSGLYEAAIEHLASRELEGKVVRPKLVASTATVRRAQTQIRELFARNSVEIFPPPGPDRRDSFFARTVSPDKMPARKYLGVAAPGRSLKVVLLRTYLALLSAAQRHYLAEGGEKNKTNPADPYMTLLGYFNSLRDLGGSRRIIEDEVLNRLPSMTRSRKRFREESAPHFQNRRIKFSVIELTSRESNADVARAKRKLEQSFYELDERVDVAIATNMISVGLDITRLGLMVVLGQPKTTAEYIQASSRVGRDEKRPGLVVTLLNVHKPRDRSHFERFEHFHETFYRSVEATSVTPFSPRAIDRALPGVVVGLTRHGRKEFTAPRAAKEMASRRAEAAWVAKVLEERAKRAGHAADASDVHGRVTNLLDDWHRIATEQVNANSGLQYQREVGTDPALLHTPLDPNLVNLTPPRDRFKANRSLRDVEPSVNLFIRIPGTDRILEEG